MEINSSHENPESISSSSSTLPWSELPNDIAILILERLPLTDYIRFSSVCQKWRSIQKDHRQLHAPNPPPMLKSFPWLISNLKTVATQLHCYSLSDSKFIHLHFSNTAHQKYSFSSSKGWIFLINELNQVSIVNPLTNMHMQLPPINTSLGIYGALSSSPLDSNCVALILDTFSKLLYLSRVGQKQHTWSSISYSDNQLYDSCHEWAVGHEGAFYCSGKFYCVKNRICIGLSVIDPESANPVNKMLNMDYTEMVAGLQFHYFFELRGELICLAAINGRLDSATLSVYKDFQVFRADFCGLKWRRMNDVVDLVFFLSTKGSLCLSASDVGCKGNCVYYMDTKCKFWRVFDMDSKQWSYGLRCPPFGTWESFSPSLDFVDLT